MAPQVKCNASHIPIVGEVSFTLRLAAYLVENRIGSESLKCANTPGSMWIRAPSARIVRFFAAFLNTVKIDVVYCENFLESFLYAAHPCPAEENKRLPILFPAPNSLL